MNFNYEEEANKLMLTNENINRVNYNKGIELIKKNCDGRYE